MILNFFNLPLDLMSYIYQYDTTFKDIFTKIVLPDIWVMSWKFYLKRISKKEFKGLIRIEDSD